MTMMVKDLEEMLRQFPPNDDVSFEILSTETPKDYFIHMVIGGEYEGVTTAFTVADSDEKA